MRKETVQEALERQGGLLGRFLLSQRVEEHKAPITLRNHRWALRDFLAWCGDRDPCVLTSEELQGYIAYVRQLLPNPERKGGDAGYAASTENSIRPSGRMSPTCLGRGFQIIPDGCSPASETRTNQSIDPHAERWLQEVGQRAGIRGSLAPHRLRHSFITRAVDAGWPQLVLQKQIGHSNPMSTAWYYRPSRKGLLDTYRRTMGPRIVDHTTGG